MAGGSGPRNVNSRYQRAREESPRDADAGDGSSDGRRLRARSSGSGSGSRRGRPPLARQRGVPEEERRITDSSEDEQVQGTSDGDEGQEDEAQEGDEDEAQEDEAGGSTAAAGATPYLRGPSKLHAPPLPALRPVIRPLGDR